MAIAMDRIHAPDTTAVEEPRSGLPFAFTGRAGEYFGIWIVNLLLSIITLGIYSAWAKVRTKRYFYGNTRLDGSTFDYLASPIQVLKGRLIAFVILTTVTIIGSTWPVTILPFALILFLIIPWSIVRSRAFNAHYSAYRNVRFSYSGGLVEACKIYILWPILSFLTIGGLFPYSHYLSDRFLVEKHSYGQMPLAFYGRPRGYYRIYGLALLLALPAALIWAAPYLYGFFVAIQTMGLDPEQVRELVGTQVHEWFLRNIHWLMIMFIISILLSFIAPSYLAVHHQNYLFNNVKIGSHELQLNLKLSRFLWIRLSNLAAIILSAGLMIPWARIRMARYQIERMSLVTHGDLDTLIGEQQRKTGAYGDELAEGMDLDLGLGV